MQIGDIQVWFVDPERNRRISYDYVYRIDFLNGGIRIYCLDGFSTILNCYDSESSLKIEVVGVIV